MAQSEPMRILYIEDDPGLARLVQKRLGKNGFTVDIASDGEEGVAKYQNGSYDLLCVDQSLPIHDGLEVIRILGSNGSLPPTVMITGTGDERVAVEAMKLGAGDYIVKDVEGGYLELLPSVIEKMIQQRRALEEKQQAEKELRESEERYRTLVENIDFGITRMDADHNIVMINTALCRRHNKNISDFIGEKCYRAFRKRDTVCPHCPGVLAMTTGQPAEVETGVVETDQDLFPVRLQTFPILQEDGTVSGFIEVVGDISERKKVEKTLKVHKEALQNSFFGTAEALSKVIEDRDPYTSGHSVGVAGFAEAIARLMGFSEDQVTGVYIAGLLHDIGKMAVPVEVLVKPGRLTDMEMSLIHIHPEAGYEILKGIDFPWPVGQATLQHHERMDGSGYPHGVKGDTIIREARILAVADVVDAMTHHRPYRPAFSVQDAMEEISKGRLRLYDPQVVDACIEVLEGEEAFTSSVYSMSSTSPQPRRGSIKSSTLPTTTMIRSSGRR
jgi:PAS domain S-box-containing protein/putative nucleotidyltransferase with HDIG domain